MGTHNKDSVKASAERWLSPQVSSVEMHFMKLHRHVYTFNGKIVIGSFFILQHALIFWSKVPPANFYAYHTRKNNWNLIFRVLIIVRYSLSQSKIDNKIMRFLQPSYRAPAYSIPMQMGISQRRVVIHLKYKRLKAPSTNKAVVYLRINL